VRALAEGVVSVKLSVGTPSHKEHINVWWVIGSFIAGVALIAAAFVTEYLFAWNGAAIETLVGVGTSLLLAAVLFFLQRRFVSVVEEVAIRAAETAADARVEQRVRQVDARIDELRDRINAELTARNLRQDSAVQALDVPTYMNVATALAEANRLGAIADGTIRVQGSRERGELALDFSWTRQMADGRFSLPDRTELMVKAYIYADERARSGRPVIQKDWGPGDSAKDVGLELREQLERRGRWHGEGTLDWPMALKNLQASLDLAIRSRRRDGSGPSLQGALIERVGDEWAVTDAGLECPSRGYLLMQSEFPNLIYPRSQQDPPPPFKPVRPEWADPSLWQELLAEGRRFFPRREGPFLHAPTWMPLTEGPTPIPNS
jgi:hypothetical protein